MKKILLLFISIALLFSFSACELSINFSDDISEIESPKETTSKPQIDSSYVQIKGYEKTADQLLGEQNSKIDRIVYAYKTNDKSYLKTNEDIFIYQEATRIISSIIDDNMTDFEKEKAIHDYIIINNTYDTDATSNFNKLSEDSKSMYGFFKNGKSICLGYTQTFQLFMDMLDITCITIHSTANFGEEHAWNMVKLDDEWYQVDVTWNDPIPDKKDRVLYKYFNVTNIYMKRNNHEWDENHYPIANSTKYSVN